MIATPGRPAGGAIGAGGSPEGADDPEVLQTCYDEITGVMQGTLDRLSEENPYPVLTRSKELGPARMLSRLADSLRP